MDEFMRVAIDEAKRSLKEGGLPIGAVLVRDNKIIGRGHNKRVQKNDPIMHAEIDCLQNAGRIGNYEGTTMYSTLMPCHMCAGALVQFGVKKVVAGESENFSGAREFMESKGIEVVDLDLAECKRMLQNFIGENPLLWNEDIGCS